MNRYSKKIQLSIFSPRHKSIETRFFLTEGRNYKIDRDQKIIYSSSIFNWYEKDFTTWFTTKYPDRESSLLSYIELYLTPERAEELKAIANSYTLRFIPYDWRLDDQKSLIFIRQLNPPFRPQLSGEPESRKGHATAGFPPSLE